MTRTQLLRAGVAAYGPRWQSDLARDLGVTDRTMRNWAGGITELPADLGPRLRAVLKARADTILAVRRELPRR